MASGGRSIRSAHARIRQRRPGHRSVGRRRAAACGSDHGRGPVPSAAMRRISPTAASHARGSGMGNDGSSSRRPSQVLPGAPKGEIRLSLGWTSIPVGDGRPWCSGSGDVARAATRTAGPFTI